MNVVARKTYLDNIMDTQLNVDRPGYYARILLALAAPRRTPRRASSQLTTSRKPTTTTASRLFIFFSKPRVIRSIVILCVIQLQ